MEHHAISILFEAALYRGTIKDTEISFIRLFDSETAHTHMSASEQTDNISRIREEHQH